MEPVHFNGRRAGRAATAAFLAFASLLAGGGCGSREGAAPASQGSASGVPVAASMGLGENQVPAGGGFEVVVAPSSPSRIAPPGISVKSPHGHGAEILAVQWLVNGEERETGQLLPPSRFQRGDRIQAVVKLRTGAGEMLVTTPEVVAVNALPSVSDVRIEPQAPFSGSTVRAVVRAQDPDGDPLQFKYQWNVDNVPVPGDGDSLTLKGVKRGSWIHVAVTLNDGTADGAWKASPRYQVVNALPVVASVLPKEVPPGRKLVYQVVAEDGDGDPLTYTLTKGPPGMILTGSTLTWQVPDESVGKQVDAVVEISDGSGGRTVQNISMTIQPPK